MSSTIERIRELEDAGLISSENCPEREYWNWHVKDIKDIPEDLLRCVYGDEIRWYGEN